MIGRFSSFISKLKHSELPAQLLPFLTDNRKSLYARRIATDIAEACETHEVENELVIPCSRPW